MNDTLPAEAATRFLLGDQVVGVQALHGGVNRVWKLQTNLGTFAIHELLGVPGDLTEIYRFQQILELEVRAAAAGVLLARPIPLPDSGFACAQFSGRGLVCVHEWVAGVPVNRSSPPPSFYRELGSSLGRLHELQQPIRAVDESQSGSRSTRETWEQLAVQAGKAGWPWARSLAEDADRFVEVAQRLDEWDMAAGGRMVFSHRDLTGDNVLDVVGRPVLIDWESAGVIGCGSELGRTALDQIYSRPAGVDTKLLRELFGGYGEVSPIPPVDESWCTLWIRGLLDFGELCARSCLLGIAPRSLLDFQSHVVEAFPAMVEERLGRVNQLLEQFVGALPKQPT